MANPAHSPFQVVKRRRQLGVASAEYALLCVAIIGALLGLLAPEATCQPATVQQQPLIVEGRILWVDFGSQTMALAPANGSPVIVIDLHRIGQSDYHGFRGSEYVRVVGYILRPSPRIQAFELYLVTPWFPTTPQSP